MCFFIISLSSSIAIILLPSQKIKVAKVKILKCAMLDDVTGLLSLSVKGKKFSTFCDVMKTLWRGSYLPRPNPL